MDIVPKEFEKSYNTSASLETKEYKIADYKHGKYS